MDLPWWMMTQDGEIGGTGWALCVPAACPSTYYNGIWVLFVRGLSLSLSLSPIPHPHSPYQSIPPANDLHRHPRTRKARQVISRPPLSHHSRRYIMIIYYVYMTYKYRTCYIIIIHEETFYLFFFCRRI